MTFSKMFSNSGSRAIVIFTFQTFCRNRLFNVPVWYMYFTIAKNENRRVKGRNLKDPYSIDLDTKIQSSF